MRKIFFGILLIMAISLVGIFLVRASFLQKAKITKSEKVSQLIDKTEVKKDAVVEVKKEDQSINEPISIHKIANANVPFTSQAPTGNWSEQRFQNGCEEASVLMAMKWIKNEKFSSRISAEKEIFDIAKFEEKTFGTFIDATVEDVGEILSQYYDFKNFIIKSDPSLDDLKNALADGNIILVPAFGRALKNPNFTRPGPITHMLVLIGYDKKTREFITNDPGTRKGESYRYNEKVLFNAIWAYPSGKTHPEPPIETLKKAMLVVRKK